MTSTLPSLLTFCFVVIFSHLIIFFLDNSYASYAIRKDVVTTGQGIGLVFFSLVLVGLSIYAAFVRHQVAQKFSFHATTHEPLSGGMVDKNDMRRQESGIMICRSKSNISYKAPSDDTKFV